MRRTARLAIAGLGIAAAFTLSACANPLDGLIEGVVGGGVENIIEGAIEGETGSDVDINVPGTGGGSLPSSWPSDVPTPSGDILFSLASDGTFAATIDVGDAAAVEAIYAELEGAGYTIVSEADLGGIVSKIYENDAYTVTVGTMPDDGSGSLVVQYGISPKSQE